METITAGRTEGKVVVVTGAAGGQGAAEARALAAEGATVIATDLAAPDLPAPIVPRALDVTSEAAWTELAAWLRQNPGLVDGLVNNAGIALRLRLHEITRSATRSANGACERSRASPASSSDRAGSARTRSSRGTSRRR